MSKICQLCEGNGAIALRFWFFKWLTKKPHLRHCMECDGKGFIHEGPDPLALERLAERIGILEGVNHIHKVINR